MAENAIEFSRSRISVFRISYGITLDDFFAIVEYQNGDCPICLRNLLSDMTVDHDHSFGDGKELKKLPVIEKRRSIRGVLHHSCNLWLGVAEKYPWLVSEYVRKYLDSPPAQEVLPSRTELPSRVRNRISSSKVFRTVDGVKEKWCPGHLTYHVLDAFYPRPNFIGGYSRQCREYLSEYRKLRSE